MPLMYSQYMLVEAGSACCVFVVWADQHVSCSCVYLLCRTCVTAAVQASGVGVIDGLDLMCAGARTCMSRSSTSSRAAVLSGPVLS